MLQAFGLTLSKAMTDAPQHLLIAHKTKADTSILCDRGVRYFCALIGSCSAFLGVVNGVVS